MKKKIKLLLNETLDKAISPPKRADRTKLDSLLDEYHEPDRPNLLAEKIKPASEIASIEPQTPALLAPLSAEPASKLAENIKPAGRTESQLLADARKSKGARTQIAIRIGTELKREIDAFLLKYEITQQDFFELAASTFMAKVLADAGSEPASKLAHNNKELITIWKTEVSIIDCYTKTLNKKWKPHDDRAAYRFNGTDIRLIELGILQTLANAGSAAKINSFKYCVPEIEEWAKTPMSGNSLDVVLQVNRDKLKNRVR